MKKNYFLHYFSLWLAIFTISFISCTKEDDSEAIDNRVPDASPVVILPHASASFQYDTCLTIQFRNESTNATSYRWEFGDGQTSTAVNPTHTYASKGIYHLKFSAFNSGVANVAIADINMNSYITLTNNSSDPYAVYIDDIEYETVSGDASSTIEINPGCHHVKVVQKSGYWFYATVKNYDVSCYAGGGVSIVNFPNSSKNEVQINNQNIQRISAKESFNTQYQ